MRRRNLTSRLFRSINLDLSIMKHRAKTVALLISAVLALTACGGGGGADSPAAGANASWMDVAADGTSTISSSRLGTALSSLPVESLSAAEQASLAYMREEEKLAHDVYAYLNTLWGASLPIFNNIAASEATHAAAVLTLLQRYSLADPAATTAAGQFVNPTLQSLYAQLTASGARSLVDALKVGAEIEEVDIVDLQAALVYVDNQDIRAVYGNLLKGSRNHLRAFVQALQQQGVVYTPQYLTPADYQAIVGTSIEAG